jgi:hypothetical protein
MNIITFLEAKLGGNLGGRLEQQALKLSDLECRHIAEEWISFEYELPLPPRAERATIVSTLCDRSPVSRDLISKVLHSRNSDPKVHRKIVDSFDVYPAANFIKTILVYTEPENLRYLRKLLLVYDQVILPYDGKLLEDLEASYNVNGYLVSLLVRRLRILKPFMQRGLIQLLPHNNPAAWKGVDVIELDMMLRRISRHDELWFNYPASSEFISEYYYEAINFASRLHGFISTNSFPAYDMLLNLLEPTESNPGLESDISTPSSFSLLLDHIQLPSLERIGPEEQALFTEQAYQYKKFRTLVSQFLEAIQNNTTENDPEALAKFGKQCARDIFQPAVDGYYSKKIPETLKDAAANAALTFVGLQAVQGLPVDIDQLRIKLLESAGPALAVLLKDMIQATRQRLGDNKLFIHHCGLFLDSKSLGFSADVVSGRVLGPGSTTRERRRNV